MKKKANNGVLGKIIVILLIVLISIISFLGIHKKNLNKWDDVIPEFILGKDLGEARIFNFEVSSETKDVEVETAQEETTQEKATDVEGDVVEGTELDQEATTEEEPATTKVPVNSPELLTVKNFRKVKSTIEKRLHKYEVNDATVTIDEANGNLTLVVPNNRATDYVVSLVTDNGKVEIVDSDTEEVLMNNDLITKATTGYNQSRTTSTSSSSQLLDIGISLDFNTKGKDKLNELSKTYIETINEEGDAVQKTITIRVNGEDVYRTYFDPEGSYSSIFVPIYTSVDAEDTKTLNDNYSDCLIIASAINGGALDIEYEVVSGTYMSSYLGENFVRNVVIVIAVILCALAIYVALKYGKKGLMVDVIELGFVALLALLLRYASVTITFIGLITFLLMSFLNYFLAVGLMEKEKVENFAKFLRSIVPLIIAIVVFVFAGDINAKSMGMIGFWSLIGYVYTFLVSLVLFKNNEKGAKKHE